MRIRGEQFLHSTCNIKDKVCNLIIDSGSCKNVVFIEAIKKLHLTIESHPKPYKLTRLDRDTEVIMNRRWLVSFFIGQKNLIVLGEMWYQ
jgi:hypothetical protein